MVARMKTAPGLRQALGQALPRRLLPVKRDALIDAMLERIETWRGINSELVPHAERTKRLTKVNDDLKKALEKAGAALKRLGVDADIERIQACNAALGIVSKHGPGPLAGRSAAVDLYLTSWQALDQLRLWDRMHRRKKGTPRAFSAELTEHLQELCRQRAGLSQYEFENVLAAVSRAEGITRALSVETLKKRKQRKQRGTK